MTRRRIPLSQLNAFHQHDFVAVCGAFFESSPWIAEQVWHDRPFGNLGALHRKLLECVAAAGLEAQLELIRAHPDLVGNLARHGGLSPESQAEQAAAGLTALTPAEVDLFEAYNARYRERFGFPFVICARENRKEAILATFPARLAHDRSEEIHAALNEIGKIAGLRLADTLMEDPDVESR